ncbi:AMP-binding protein [Candidatus Pacearchaeota archaeon]|nr:AMP-binding protein [Candidatus Pacearchaeota archaeon]
MIKKKIKKGIKMKTLVDLINKFNEPECFDKVAIIDRKEYRKFSYTYGQLYDLCQRFAGFLRKNKFKKGDMIIIWAPNGIEYAAIMLGAFLEGIIVVPIDLRSNMDFLIKIQEEVKAKLIFQTRYKPLSSKLKAKVIFTEQILSELENKPAEKSNVKISKNDIAEIIYTSGTTGSPKGVILTNKNLISNINALNTIEKIRPESKFLSILPLSHVFEQTVGFFIPLSNKSSIIYITSLKLSSLFEAFSEEKPTHIVIVPRLLDMLYSGIMNEIREMKKEKQFSSALKIAPKLPDFMKKMIFRKIHKKFGNKLEYFICGGAALNPELENFYNSIGIPIVQGYGLTETSPVLTTNLFRERKVSSIGKIIPDTRIKLSRQGEILAKGPGITSGYYKNPEKTKSLFERGWLKTGDLGYIDKEGFLFLKGRKKDLIVTSGGINVYPEDIEAVLNKISGIKDSCVIGMERENKGEEIHAVLLLEREIGKAEVEKIINEANKKLDASQKIQNYTVWHDKDFPRTTTMKIKKFAIKEAVQKKSEIEQPTIVKKEDKIYNILSHLTAKKISEDKSLQDLGLSSIDRVELVSLLEQNFNIEIDEEKIFSNTKVKKLEGLVKQRKKIEEKLTYRKWALYWPSRIIRFLLQQIIILPICIKSIARVKVEGNENLKNLDEPVIFVSNHQSHYDIGVVLSKLPLKFSQKIATAAWREFFFNPDLSFKVWWRKALFYLGTLIFNIYPFPVQKGYKKGMRYTGRLIEKGWNILIFPEGQRTKTGKILPFKQGIGMLAVELKSPVVPIKIENVNKILPIGKFWPKPGRVNMKIGKPIRIRTDSYIKATEIIENAVKNL